MSIMVVTVACCRSVRSVMRVLPISALALRLVDQGLGAISEEGTKPGPSLLWE